MKFESSAPSLSHACSWPRLGITLATVVTQRAVRGNAGRMIELEPNVAPWWRGASVSAHAQLALAHLWANEWRGWAWTWHGEGGRVCSPVTSHSR